MKPSKRLNNISEYYFSKKLAQIKEMSRTGRQVINLGIGNPDMQPPAEAIDRLAYEAKQDNNHGYQSYRGLDRLRVAFAQWYRRVYGVSLDPESEVLPLIGSKEGIFYLSMAYLDPGDKVLVPDVGYPAYSAVARMLGAQAVTYDVSDATDWYPDFDDLNKRDLKGVKMMWLNYPNMPSGQPATRELFEKAVEFGHRHGILICHDNPYSFILNDNPLSIFSVQGAKQVAVELNSLSKTFNMAGWRVGVMTGANKLIKPAFTVMSNIQSGMFKPIQLAAIEALNVSSEWLAEQNKQYLKRKNIVFQILDALNCTYRTDGQGLFVWAAVPDVRNGYEFSEEILQKSRVFLTPGGIFGKNGLSYIRVSLCSNGHLLEEALDRIRKIFK